MLTNFVKILMGYHIIDISVPFTFKLNLPNFFFHILIIIIIIIILEWVGAEAMKNLQWEADWTRKK